MPDDVQEVRGCPRSRVAIDQWCAGANRAEAGSRRRGRLALSSGGDRVCQARE